MSLTVPIPVYLDKPDISDLFDKNINSEDGNRIISKQIKNDFLGFIFTGRTNSGSFSRKLRIQVTLHADVFREIK